MQMKRNFLILYVFKDLNNAFLIIGAMNTFKKCAIFSPSNKLTHNTTLKNRTK